MYQYDLYGNATVIPEKTFEEEYKTYIASAAWHRLRDEKIASVDGKCERCGISKWSARLEVHHKHYDTFKKESFSDLEVLCQECHELADNERINARENSAPERSLMRGFENWMDRGNHQGWRRLDNNHLHKDWKAFLSMISARSGKDYSKAKFKRNPNWR